MQTLPVCGEAFFDRTELLDRILRRALDLTAGYRQNLALLGPLRIGKSSILQRAVELLARHPQLLPMSLEVRADATLVEFVEQFACTLLHRYAAAEGRTIPQTFEDLAKYCQPYIPRTTVLLTRAIGQARRRRTEALSTLFEAPGLLREESGRFCIILLDEFDRLAAWSRAKPFAALGRQIIVQQATMYLLASSSEDAARAILQERLAVLFGHFEVVRVGPFELPTAEQYLGTHRGLGWLGLSRLIGLADLTAGQPAELSWVADVLQCVSEDGRHDPAARVSEAMIELLFKPSGALSRRCHEMLAKIPVRRRAATMPVLAAVAQGHHRVVALAAATGLSVPEVTRAVRVLVTAGVVTRRGVLCCIEDRLLQFWLRTVYPIQSSPVQLPSAAAEQAFSDQVRRWLEQAAARAPQAVLEVVAELMRRFQNEMLEWHGKRVRFPRLDVHTLLLPGAPRAVVGQREDTQWFCVPYTATIREQDAVALVQTLRHVAKPWRRRIVVAVEGLEVNARLFLQEQRFWVWELADLNQLLELYGLPRLLPIALQAAQATVTSVPSPSAEVVAAQVTNTHEATA